MAQQTAVEWLYNQLYGFNDKEWSKIDKTFQQAKQMEKEQIIKAHSDGFDHIVVDFKKQEFAEQYYNKTYGKSI